MGKIVVDSTSLETYEKGSGQPLVLIHGSASDYRTWQHQMDSLSKDFRVISYSRRYHYPNVTISESADYSMVEHVADLQRVLNTLDAKPAHLVGHSYGALMGLELASQQPAYVKSLILAEPPAINLFVKNSNAPTPGELLRLLLRRPRTGLAVIKLGATGLEPAAQAAKKGDMEKVMQLFGRAALGKESFQAMPIERREQVLANLTKAEFLGSGYIPLNTEKLRTIKAPTLLLTGEKSPRVFHHLANCLKDLIPKLERVEIPAASHILHEDNPDAFNSELLRFLKSKSFKVKVLALDEPMCKA
ncbi:MAG: alpha/beta hydrolase [Trueperaceae bacterium]|nr:alpha/beta hydrolase [Trueperaceae bacterium]